MAAISAGDSRQFTATLTAPISAPPKRKSKYAMPLRSRKATRSPAANPVSPHGLGHLTGHHIFLAPLAALVTLHEHLVVGLRGGEGTDQAGDRVAVLLGVDVR